MTLPVASAPVGRAPLKAQVRAALSGAARTESWVRRVARDYARIAPEGVTVAEFVATRLQSLEGAPRSITYADPTGDTAARNVDRERKRKS